MSINRLCAAAILEQKEIRLTTEEIVRPRMTRGTLTFALTSWHDPPTVQLSVMPQLNLTPSRRRA